MGISPLLMFNVWNSFSLLCIIQMTYTDARPAHELHVHFVITEILDT